MAHAPDVTLARVRRKVSQAENALHGLEDKFYKLRGGKGIAFTVPLSSVIGVGLYKFLSNNKAFGTEEK